MLQLSSSSIIDESYALVFPGQGTYGIEFVDKIKNFSNFNQRYRSVCEVMDNDPLAAIQQDPSHFYENSISSVLIVLTSCLALDEFYAHQHNSPSWVAGYSVGQWTGLYAAGVIEFHTLIHTIVKRAKWMDAAITHTPSGMVAVIGVSEQVLSAFCESMRSQGYLIYISNFNCPGQYTLAGTESAIQQCMPLLEQLCPKKLLRVPTKGAWHTDFLEDASRQFEAYLDEVELKTPNIPVICNVTGDRLSSDAKVMREQLAQHIKSPVQWEKGIRMIIRQGCQWVVEVGYGNILTKFGYFIDRSVNHSAFFKNDNHEGM